MSDTLIPPLATDHAAAPRSIAPITGEALAQRAAAIRVEVGKAFIGQAEALDHVLIALLAGGHVLIEGVPGLGKTLLVRALARTLDCGYARVQFTPDLMPSDISGHAVYDPKTETFNIRRGPVFTNLLLADEINRAPAKTQSALLEAMQELQVTIEGHSFELPPPFLTLATQNPVEQEGTYPLPEAQLDRFLLKVLIGYPSRADEKKMVVAVSQGRMASDFDLSQVQRVVGPEEIVAMQLGTALVTVDDDGQIDLVLAALRAAGEHLPFVLSARIADRHAEQEAVELRLRQRIGPLVLDRVLRREHEERSREHVGGSIDGDLSLLHRLE